MSDRTQQRIAAAAERFRIGEIALPELLCREALASDPSSTRASEQHLEAAEQAEEASRRRGPEEDPTRERYLLIKAWGCGFWSDVDHVLGMLLLAEATGRTPIVHWGTNSRFREPATDNALGLYFKPISARTIADLRGRGLSFFPGKWREDNLREDNLNVWEGPTGSTPRSSRAWASGSGCTESSCAPTPRRKPSSTRPDTAIGCSAWTPREPRGRRGLHFLNTTDRRRLGVEVMKDVYLAARCSCFMGLGLSNVTCMVLHLKE